MTDYNTVTYEQDGFVAELDFPLNVVRQCQEPGTLYAGGRLRTRILLDAAQKS